MKSLGNNAALCLFIWVTSLSHLLAQEDFEFDESSLETIENRWWKAFKTTLAHSQTFNDEDHLTHQRSSLQIEFEKIFFNSWYIRIDGKSTYYSDQDILSENQPKGLSDNKWQDFWVQYSGTHCNTKLGKQKLLWGAVEGTFAVDVVTPFDSTEQLFTDYSNLRTAQDMLTLECFSKIQAIQLFIVHNAELDTVSLTENFDLSSKQTGTEWGGRWKIYRPGIDLSLLFAQLYQNQPTTVSSNNIDNLAVAQQDFVGLSASIGQKQWLYKADLGLKYQHSTYLITTASWIIDFALGLEYTTPNNHNFNAGFWKSKSQEPLIIDLLLFTAGWSHSYWQDTLSVNLLTTFRDAYHSLYAQYQLNDYWQISAAVTNAHINNNENTPFPIASGTSVTGQIKWQF